MYPPAGWHPDPYDPALQRWWDGQQWTAQTRPAGAADPTLAFAPIGGPADPGTPAGGEPSRKRKKWPWIAGAAVVGMVGISALNQDPPKSEADSTVVTSTTIAAPTTTTTRVPRTTTPATTSASVVPPLQQNVETTTTEAYVPPTTTVAPPRTTEQTYVPPAPAYTPAPAATQPTYTPEAPSIGTVHPGSFCDTLGTPGVTKKGTAMVCAPGSDGRLRWQSAG